MGRHYTMAICDHCATKYKNGTQKTCGCKRNFTREESNLIYSESNLEKRKEIKNNIRQGI